MGLVGRLRREPRVRTTPGRGPGISSYSMTTFLPGARKGDNVTEPTERGGAVSDLSTGELVKQATEQLSLLIRSEMRLALAERDQQGRQAVPGGGYLGGAGAVGFVALQAAAATAIIALALVLPLWLSALLVTVTLLLAAGVLALSGKWPRNRASPAAAQTVGGVRADPAETSQGAQR